MNALRLFSLVLAIAGTATRACAVDVFEHPAKGRQYETARFRFAQNLGFGNPFDLVNHRVELEIQQPDFSRQVLSFVYDGLNKEGVEKWEARFAPAQSGMHRVSLRIMGKTQGEWELLVAPVEGKGRGGLKVSDRLGVFDYEGGGSFRGIGLNVCWAEDYEYYFRKMRGAGMTVTRIWMCPWNLPFEWNATGLGRYDLTSARRLDTLLQLADNYGVSVILCLDFHGVAPKGLGFFREDRWRLNPYNSINGGPCAEADELFTNEQAKSLLKQRYKYIVSRFGHSSRLLAWEFYNEADLMAGKAIPMNRWHIEMAEYIRSIDIHHRLVSTSSTRRYVEKVVDAFRSPAMDFVMFHDYNAPNMAEHLTNLIETGLEYYQKPVVIGEFGVEFRGGERTHTVDPSHVGLHNGLWAGWFSETPVVPMSWWWDNYIDKYDLWSEYENLSRFAATLEVHAGRLEFRTLPAGRLEKDTAQQAGCMVRCIYNGANIALWLKNIDYQWSIVSEGTELKQVGPFTQAVPGLAPGRYAVTWYEPHTGRWSDKSTELEVHGDGELRLPVPSLVWDLACIVRRKL